MTGRIARAIVLAVVLAAAAVACDRVVDLSQVPPDGFTGNDGEIPPDGIPGIPDGGIDAHPLPDASTSD